MLTEKSLGGGSHDLLVLYLRTQIRDRRFKFRYPFLRFFKKPICLSDTRYMLGIDERKLLDEKIGRAFYSCRKADIPRLALKIPKYQLIYLRDRPLLWLCVKIILYALPKHIFRVVHAERFQPYRPSLLRSLDRNVVPALDLWSGWARSFSISPIP